MIFYNQPLKYSASPKRHIRLFKRANASYSNDIVHEKIQLPPDIKIGKLKQAIMHHSYQDVSHVLYKLNKYSSYSAKIRIDSEKKIGFEPGFNEHRLDVFSLLYNPTWLFRRKAWVFIRCI